MADVAFPESQYPPAGVEKSARILKVEADISTKLCHPIVSVVNADKLFLLRPESSSLVLVTVPEVTINEDGEAFSGDYDVGFSWQRCVA
jgi:hypothetical protein